MILHFLSDRLSISIAISNVLLSTRIPQTQVDTVTAKYTDFLIVETTDLKQYYYF